MSTEYASSIAEEESLPLIKVQHHHAHMAACMADNGQNGSVIGLVWDGTGLGTDGTIWGAECPSGTIPALSASAVFPPVPLIGGDRAVRRLTASPSRCSTPSGCDTGSTEKSGDI